MAETKAAAKPTLNKQIYNVEVTNHELLKVAYDSYLAAARGANATTKQRGEVRGGGKKPWKQKGTGRARFGSSRNPIWRGGGIVFGPRGNENYTKKLSTGAKQTAVRQALSLARAAGKIEVIDFAPKGRTRDVVEFLSSNKLDVRRVLIAVDTKTPEMVRASRNLQSVNLLTARYLSVYHILNADKIVLTPGAVKMIDSWLGKEAK